MEDCRVVVIGAGSVGLSTALACLDKGFSNVEVIAEQFSPYTTSDGAGAIWRPFGLSAEVPQPVISRWGRKTYNWLMALQQKYGDASGVHEVPGVELMMTSQESYPYWAHIVKEFRFMTEAELAREGHGFTFGYSYKTLVVHPKYNLKLMQEMIVELGGTLTQRKIHHLDEISADVIINCAGISGGKVSNEPNSMFPVRGQVIKVHQPQQRSFCIVHEGPLSLSYIIPRPDGEVILGGTTQTNDWNTNVSSTDENGIWKRATTIRPIVQQGQRLGNWVGLRPQRHGGPRVGLDPQRTKQNAIVLHNYGHGGSGYTIHIGCADEIAEIAVNQLRQQSRL